MLELIALALLITSFLGMIGIIFYKIPVLIELPQTEEDKSEKESLFKKLKEKIKEFFILAIKSFPLEKILQKILSKIRILTLKLENRIAIWLQKLREKAHKKKTEESDNYWKRLKKIMKSRK